MATCDRSSQIPQPAFDYFSRIFGTEFVPGYHSPVLIAQTFSPERGWRQHPTRKRVSSNWLRGLRREGTTHVALAYGGRQADFSIAELLSRKGA